MTTVERRDEQLDSGHLAVLGHRLLSAAAVVAGAITTIRDSDAPMTSGQQVLLQDAMDRNLDAITEIARSLIHGDGRA
jgi:hypothetical protein